MSTKVDAYIQRSTKWPAEMVALRAVLRASGLQEDKTAFIVKTKKLEGFVGVGVYR